MEILRRDSYLVLLKLIKYWDKIITIALLSLIMLLGLTMRLHKLGIHNFWYDEVLAYYFAKNLNIINIAILDFHPPFYFILLKAWINLFGSSEFCLRSLSMLFGVFSIFVIFRLGKLIFNERTGLASAFILSLSPIHIWYSQEARGYSLSVFLALFSVYYLFSALKRNKAYKWLIFILFSGLTLYTSYFYIFIIIISGALFFSKDFRPLLKYYLICVGAMGIIFVPFCPLLFQQISRINDSFWIPKPNLNSLGITFENFNTGYNSTFSINLFTSMLFVLLFLSALIYWWNKRRRELLLLAMFIFVPVISSYLISQKMPVYLDRQLLLFSPFYYLILAAGLANIKIRGVKIFACFCIFIPFLVCLKNYYGNYMPLPREHHVGVLLKKTAKPAADYIRADFQKEDIIAISDKNAFDVFYYLMPNISLRQIVFFYIEESFKHEKYPYNYKRLTYDQLYGARKGLKSHVFQLEGKPTIPGIRMAEEIHCKRIWLVSSSWLRDGVLGEHAKAVREYMQRHYESLDHKELGGIIIDLYGQRKD